jgi:hypothetical protein
MMHRHLRRELALQKQRFTWRGAPRQSSEERQDSALIERPRREELGEILRQQRLHFLLLERAMQNLSSDAPDGAAPAGSHLGAQLLPAADARTALQQDLEAILLAELCDESEIDPSKD